jgi:hypothetical protein
VVMNYEAVTLAMKRKRLFAWYRSFGEDLIQ